MDTHVKAKPAALDDAAREFWIGADDGIYRWWLASGQRVVDFIERNRAELDRRIEAFQVLA